MTPEFSSDQLGGGNTITAVPPHAELQQAEAEELFNALMAEMEGMAA